MTNQIVTKTVKELRQASTKNKAPIWSKVAEMRLKPSVARRVVNLGRLDHVTKDNDVVFVPGKVLGTGNISHKITLCCFSISTTAAQKVQKAGGKIVNHSDMIAKFPTGKGVRIIG